MQDTMAAKALAARRRATPTHIRIDKSRSKTCATGREVFISGIRQFYAPRRFRLPEETACLRLPPKFAPGGVVRVRRQVEPARSRYWCLGADAPRTSYENRASSSLQRVPPSPAAMLEAVPSMCWPVFPSLELKP